MKETILMIHGMWCGSWVWDNYKVFFGDRDYTCITPTLRYHDMDPNDQPDPAQGRVSLLDYAEDLETLIRKLDGPPIIIGHSMGGLLTQILARRGLAETAILLTPASPSGIIALTPSVLKSFRSILTRWGFWRKPMRQTFEEADYAMLGLLPPQKKKEIYDRLVYESGRAGFEIGFWYLDSRKAAGVDESKINCPMMIISGTDDKITPASVIRKIGKKYRDIATYKEYPDHAHWIMDEPGWEEIAEDTSAWIDKIMSVKRLEIQPYVEKRSYKRLGYDAPILLNLPDSNTPSEGRMDNYSIEGVQFTSDVSLKPGATINVKFIDSAPGVRGPKPDDDYKAVVMWNKEKDGEPLYDIGARFAEIQ